MKSKGITSSEIKKRQNDPLMLKSQYAARCYFNKAEKLNYYAWGFCFISAFSVFFPDTISRIIPLIISFVADIAAWWIMVLAKKYVMAGAALRRFFDSYVLGLEARQYTEDEKRRLIETADRQIRRNKKTADQQMSNTAVDNPPGVYDWYMFSKDYEKFEAQFECQKQNTWWNKKLTNKRILILSISLIVVLVPFIIMMIKSDALKTLLCSAGLIVMLLERISENWKYYCQSYRIEGAQAILDVSHSNGGLTRFQEMINARREINVLEINYLHRKQSSLLTDEYSKISNT